LDFKITLEYINDKIEYQAYDDNQIMDLINTLLRIDLMALDFETREVILYVLCGAAFAYDVAAEADWSNIYRIEDQLEDFLKEYVQDIKEAIDGYLRKKNNTLCTHNE